MSQNDFVIDNASFPATRADLSAALQALASNSSGSSDPATTYANMFYYDTSDNTLKMRTEADDAWVNIGYLNQSTNEFSLFDDTKVVNSSGTQTAFLGDQATASWETGTSTTESLVSPAKVKAAIEALVPAAESPIGVGQTWAIYSRSGTTQNTTGRPIQVNCTISASTVTSGGQGGSTTRGSGNFQLSADNSTFITLGSVDSPPTDGTNSVAFSVIIPDDYYYKASGSGNFGKIFAELR